MTDRSYQALVYFSSVTSTQIGSTQAVDQVWGNTLLTDPPRIPAPYADPLHGEMSGRPWNLRVVDSSGTVSAWLADSGGRPDVLNRFVVMRMSEAGSTFASVAGGRIIGVADQRPDYDVTIGQEAVTQYHTEIFTTNDTWLYPAGVNRGGGWTQSIPEFNALTATVKRRNTFPTHGTTLQWLVEFEQHPSFQAIQDACVAAIRADRDGTWANSGTTLATFEWVRVRLGTSSGGFTDYPVKTFESFPVGPFPPPLIPKIDDVAGSEMWRVAQQEGGKVSCWILATSSQVSSGQAYSRSFVHRMGGPPTNDTPLHVGYTEQRNPHRINRAIFDGTYGGTTSTGRLVQYSSAAFDDGTTGMFYLPTPQTVFRITGPQRMGSWLAEHIHGPYGTLPFLDNSGVVRVRRTRLPGSSAFQSTSLFAFTAANMREPHPTFEHLAEEQATVIEVDGHQLRRTLFATSDHPEAFSNACDLFQVAEYRDTLRHDRAAQFGDRVVPVQTWDTGALSLGEKGPSFGEGYAPYLTPEIFDRWGDGAVRGTLYGMADATTVAAGDLARLTLETYPNFANQARGGTRLIQILGRNHEPDGGPSFDYIDLGPNVQPLGAPASLTLSGTTADPRHALTVTIGAPTTLGGAEVWLARTTSTSAPAHDSTAWRPRLYEFTSGPHLLPELGSGYNWFARAHNTAPGRIRSGWTVSTMAQTSGLPAPSSFAVGSIEPFRATASWGDGATGYPFFVYWGSTTGSPSSETFGYQLPAGWMAATLTPLSAGTTYQTWIRHYDVWGGLGSVATTTFETLSSASTAAPVVAPLGSGFIVLGGST